MRADIEQIVNTVTSWDGVTQNSHQFGGIEFNLGKVEIGHVHSSGLVDIPFTRKLREQLVAEGETGEHHILPESGWTSFYLRRPGDVDQALRLFRLSYLQKAGRRGSYAENPAAYARDLSDLRFGELITGLLSRGAVGESEDD